MIVQLVMLVLLVDLVQLLRQLVIWVTIVQQVLNHPVIHALQELLVATVVGKLIQVNAYHVLLATIAQKVQIHQL